jgi:creatinine amidohydrolase
MAIQKAVPYMFGNLNWKDLSEIEDRQKLILLLPIGSTESHGPHAPLSTDVTISLEVCLKSAQRLQEREYHAYVLPTISYAVAECARQFPGTISISPEVDTRLISDVCLSLIQNGLQKICIFNSHFEPTHVGCIYDAIEKVENSSGVRVLFTDITRKRYSSRLVDVFQMGESHADRYETSLVMAIDASLINEERRAALPYLPINLVDKIFKDGLSDFRDFGMPNAYCGDPASASAEEGERILERLSDFVIEDVESLASGERHIQRGLYGRDRQKKDRNRNQKVQP